VRGFLEKAISFGSGMPDPYNDLIAWRCC